MSFDNLWQHVEAEDDAQNHTTTTGEGTQQHDQQNKTWQRNMRQKKTPQDNSEHNMPRHEIACNCTNSMEQHLTPCHSVIDILRKLIELPGKKWEIHSSRKFLERYEKYLKNHGSFLESYKELLENDGKFSESRIGLLKSCRGWGWEGTPGKQNVNSEKVGYNFLVNWREFLMK